MPLIKSPSKKAFVSNLKEELNAGKPKAQSLAIAYSVKRGGKKRKMADGGSVPNPSPSPTPLDPDSNMSKGLKSIRGAFGNPKAHGGLIEDEDEDEMDALERHPMDMPEDEEDNSTVDEIMAKKRYSDGGEVDLDHNSMEEPNSYYSRNEDAALKEDYDDDMEDVSQPMDSNEMGDMREMDAENEDDMVSEIMRKKSKKRG